MKVVGLTGGMGTGKSSAAAILREMGVTVIDADEATRAVQGRGSEGLRRLVEAFGPGILDGNGDLDRAALARLAFAGEEARALLNSIVHPLVRAWMEERRREAEARGEAVVVMDVPLLYESGAQSMYDAVMVVDAPPEVALRRLVAGRGFAEADARARIQAQMPIDEKRARTPHVIDNRGTPAELRAQVERVWAEVTASISIGP